jgi:hypothetical protein
LKAIAQGNNPSPSSSPIPNQAKKEPEKEPEIKPVNPELEAEPISPPVEQPEAIAWEVWTYLERHRKDTLRCAGRFDLEWKADRFITEAERSKPDRNLRVHYEIQPIYESSRQESSSYESPRSEPKTTAPEVKDYDAIDVEIFS